MVTTVQKVTFPNSTHSVQHVSTFKFLIPSTFTKNGKPIKQRQLKSTAIIT